MLKIKTLLFAILTALLLAACSQVAEVPQEETPQLESTATTPGSLDTGFNKSGILLAGFSGNGGFATNVVTLPNNKSIVLIEAKDSNSEQFIIVRRYNEDGSLDRTFGGPGKIAAVLRDIAGGSKDVIPQDLVVTSEGRIFVAATGSNSPFSNDRPIIFALTKDGVLDPSFDDNGLLFPTTPIADPSKASIFAKDLFYDAVTKKLTLGGTVLPDSGNGFFWTFTVNVNQTTSFKETTVKESGQSLSLDKLEKLPTGEMVMAGHIFSGGSFPTPFLARQLENGIVLRKGPVGIGAGDFITGLKLDNGKILLSGSAFASNTGFNTQGFVARLIADSLFLDTTFGTNGVAFVSKDIRAFKLDANKKIVAVGSDGTDYLAARLTANGKPDTTFGKNGIALVSISNFSPERALAIDIDSKKRLIIVGIVESVVTGLDRAGLIRLLP
jgi:uncharacterized delta-60 repeat protein